MPHSVDFLIVTALEEERDAVLDKLPEYEQLNPTNSDIRVYYESQIPVTFPDGSSGNYQVIVISLLGMGRVQATISTADAIRRWQPRFVMLVGIAGGVAEAGVKLGDILVSDQIADYELQKLKPEGPQVRWQVYQTSPRLREVVNHFRHEKWQALMVISRPTYGTSVRHVGPIASGDKVIASNEALKLYHEHWPKLIGVEMEGAGVAVASFQAPNPPEFLMVRGVSDLADEQKCDRRCQPRGRYENSQKSSAAVCTCASYVQPDCYQKGCKNQRQSADNVLYPIYSTPLKSALSR